VEYKLGGHPLNESVIYEAQLLASNPVCRRSYGI